MLSLSGQGIVIWHLDCALYSDLMFSSVLSFPGREGKVLSWSVMDDEVGIFGDFDGFCISTRIDLSKSVFESSRLWFVSDVYVLCRCDIHSVARDLTWIHGDLELHGASDVWEIL